MSLKSRMAMPPRSRGRIWRPSSPTASIFLLRAVCSKSRLPTYLPVVKAVDTSGTGWPVVPLLDLRPQAPEELDVRGQILLALALRVRAHDESARRRVQGADDAAQALALVLVVDATRDADVVRLRHVDEIASGQGDERRDTGSLGPQRLLGDLNQHLLPFAQDVLDGRRGFAAGRGLVHLQGTAVLVPGGEHEALVVADAGRVVTGVEEGGPSEAHVYGRRLPVPHDVWR